MDGSKIQQGNCKTDLNKCLIRCTKGYIMPTSLLVHVEKYFIMWKQLLG